MSTFSRLLMAIGSALLAWFVYLQWLYSYAKNLSWFPYLITLAIFSMFILFLKSVRRGEIGHLELFGSDMETECKQGWYWPPSLLPFMQGFDLTFGLNIVLERLSTLGSIAGSPNIYHYHDQKLPSYSARVTSDSFMRANLDRGLNLFVAFIFSIRDEEGRVRYYKVGMILYMLCWVFAFFGNIGSHASSMMNEVVSTVNTVVQESATALGVPQNKPHSDGRITVSVQLSVGAQPIMPDDEAFDSILEDDKQYYRKVDGDARKYFLYAESGPDSIYEVHITEPSCVVVPSGRKIAFRTNLPPLFAVNMHNEVKYAKEIFWVAPFGWLDPLLVIPARAPWVHLHTNWSEVETNRHRFVAEAKGPESLNEGSRGGIVCFG